MTHDPLCSLSEEDEAYCCPECDGYGCQCDLIAKVRADERQRAGARVAARPYWEDGWSANVVMNRDSAIDAAEGGDGE